MPAESLTLLGCVTRPPCGWQVYAFPTRDPCVFNKHWGDSSGSRDDMVIIGADNDLYVCPRKEFDSSYVLVEGEAHRYRKVGHVYARRMVNHFFVKQTKGGRQHGNAGSYLVQNTDGSQYVVVVVGRAALPPS